MQFCTCTCTLCLFQSNLQYVHVSYNIIILAMTCLLNSKGHTAYLFSYCILEESRLFLHPLYSYINCCRKKVLNWNRLSLVLGVQTIFNSLVCSPWGVIEITSILKNLLMNDIIDWKFSASKLTSCLPCIPGMHGSINVYPYWSWCSLALRGVFSCGTELNVFGMQKLAQNKGHS